MILNGKFVLISVEKNDSKDGKTYYNANIETEDGTVTRIGCDAYVAGVLTDKYKTYDGFFEVGSFYSKDKGNQMYMRLKDARLSVK